MAEEDVDICSPDGFKVFLKENRDLVLLVTGEGCGEICTTLRDAVTKVSEEKGVPFAEVEFKAKPDGVCDAIERDLGLRGKTGEVVVFRSGTEVGRKKGTGFLEQDKKNVESLLTP